MAWLKGDEKMESERWKTGLGGGVGCKWGRVATPTPLIDMELMFGRSPSKPAAGGGAARGTRQTEERYVPHVTDTSLACEMEKAVVVVCFCVMCSSQR